MTPVRHALAILVTGVGVASFGCAHPEASAPVASPPRAAPEHAAAPTNAAPRPAADLEVGGCAIDVRIDGDEPPVDREVLDAWIRHSAEIVASYTGGEFPVPTLQITVVPSGRGGVGFGLHQDGRTIRIWVGQGTSDRAFARDWVLVHEMFHAAFPDLTRSHRWMQEGLSTYLEPVARARVGDLDEAEVWGKWVRMMDKGRPRLGDRGLDRTHTWGRTYWGGALFWMMADLEIRVRTDNRRSLQDAVVGILAAGGNGRANWSTARVVEEGDHATGTRALHDLYAAMAEAPGDVDLRDVFARLGVLPRADGSVTFDDDAPLAHIRRAMTRADGR